MAFRMKGQGAVGPSFRPAAGTLRGQGATEYLAILAIVLIIAIVAISLLGFYPNMAIDTKMTQSNAYWQTASPISIQGQSIDTDGNVSMVLLNNEARGNVSVRNITLMNPGNGSTVASTASPVSLWPGVPVTINFAMPANGIFPQNAYQYNVRIDYISFYGLPKIESGTQPITGRYAPPLPP